AEIVGIAFGLVAGLARLSRFRALNAAATAYIDFFRGVPLLVTLVWIYYGIALLFGINISAFMAGVGGLGITLGAYLAEVFRQGMIGATDTFRAFEAYSFVAVVYYALTIVVARMLTVVERRYASPR